MRTRLLVGALCVAPVLAQANAVPGTDVQIYDVTDIAYYGRQGAAYPNGEAGFMIGHSHCNRGTVNVPWVANGAGGVMADTYPKIAFLLARESGGRMVQVSGQGHSKHSTVPFNFSTGPCVPCTTTGGAFFFVGCSDTYSSGINSSQFYLGPNHEIDPWLGTWNPLGSYFDAGDPAVAGAAATDRVRSLTSSMVSAFGAVKNRIVVREQELLAGAQYYAQTQLVIVGEPVGNRGNNQCNRPVSITGSGSGWSCAATGASAFGSVLTRWAGANWDLGGNGGDDGRFLVASKVTNPATGSWHYEYAVQNVDNARAGASIRIPVDPAATITGVGFRDVDGNALNDWTWTRTAGELVFAAPAGNALEWNTFYNVWFDCSVAPGFGVVKVDQARVGPGALTVDVLSEVPGGQPVARKESVGASCGACTPVLYEIFSTPAGFDLANRSMTHTLAGGAYTIADTGAALIAPAGAALPLTDDSETTVTLPFTLPYPGGTTTTLSVCSNGFVSPAASNGTGFAPSASGLLAAALVRGVARLQPGGGWQRPGALRGDADRGARHLRRGQQLQRRRHGDLPVPLPARWHGAHRLGRGDRGRQRLRRRLVAGRRAGRPRHGGPVDAVGDADLAVRDGVPRRAPRRQRAAGARHDDPVADDRHPGRHGLRRAAAVDRARDAAGRPDAARHDGLPVARRQPDRVGLRAERAGGAATAGDP
jgi:hypothetical protein